MEDLIIDSNPLRIIEDENDYDDSNTNTSIESQVCLKIVEEENSDMNNDDRDNSLHRLSLRINDDEGVETDSIIIDEAVNNTTLDIGSTDYKTPSETPEMEHSPLSDSVVHLLGQINDIVGQMLIKL